MPSNPIDPVVRHWQELNARISDLEGRIGRTHSGREFIRRVERIHKV